MKPKRYEQTPERFRNKILDALPSTSGERAKTLEPVNLSAGTVLYEGDEAIEHVQFASLLIPLTKFSLRVRQRTDWTFVVWYLQFSTMSTVK